MWADLRMRLSGLNADGTPYESDGNWTIYRSKIGGYMDRLIVRLGGNTFRVHWILREDRSPHLHDHPFDFTSYILFGGYTERRLGGHAIRHDRGSVLRRKATDFHTLTKVDPGTVTLVWSGPKRKSWNFLVDGRTVPWREYRAQKVTR